MPHVKMFITDLDGTLFRSDHSFSTRDIGMLEKLGKMGVTRVLATGRSLFSLQRSIPVPLPVDYLIFSTGLGVAKYPEPHNHTLKTNVLSRDDTHAISTFLDQLGVDYMIQNPVPDNHIFSYRYFSKNNSDFHTRLNYYQGHGQILHNVDNIGSSSQFLAMVPGKTGPDILRDIRKQLTDFTVINSSSPFDGKTMWIEILPKAASKSKAAQWLSRQLNIQREDIAAVGNDFNDEDLLEWVGRAFVVENSPSAMKERFHVVASNDQDGVSEAVQSLFPHEPTHRFILGI